MKGPEHLVDGFDRLGDIDAANVVRCARTLLRRPLLHAAGPDGDLLGMIYRHRAVLQELFGSTLGYKLVIRRRYARLYKAGVGNDPTRGLSTMSPRGYTYLALTLATLTGCGRQVLLSRLARDVRAAGAEAGISVTDDATDRRAFTSALRQLISLGVLTETEGSVGAHAGDAAAEALITIDTDLLGHLVAGPLAEATGPRDLVELAAGVRGSRAVTVDQAVRRRLVEDSVVHYRDLPEEQAAWLRKNRTHEARCLEHFFGMVAESRAEGIAASDPQEYLTDTPFPGTSTVARIAQLALPELLGRGEPRSTDHRHPVTWQDFAEVCGDIVAKYPATWSRRAGEDPEALVWAVVDLLRRVGVLRREDSGPHTSIEAGSWSLSPSAHRWLPVPEGEPKPAAETPAEPVAERPGPTLFDPWEGDTLL